MMVMQAPQQPGLASVPAGMVVPSYQPGQPLIIIPAGHTDDVAMQCEFENCTSVRTGRCQWGGGCGSKGGCGRQICHAHMMANPTFDQRYDRDRRNYRPAICCVDCEGKLLEEFKKKRMYGCIFFLVFVLIMVGITVGMMTSMGV